MREDLFKNKIRITFMEKQNRDIKHTIKLVEDKTTLPSTSAKEKKKGVTFVEQARNVVVRSDEPIVKVFKSKFEYAQQMKQIAKSPGTHPFNQWKEY